MSCGNEKFYWIYARDLVVCPTEFVIKLQASSLLHVFFVHHIFFGELTKDSGNRAR